MLVKINEWMNGWMGAWMAEQEQNWNIPIEIHRTENIHLKNYRGKAD